MQATKATWPTTFTWTGDAATKVHRSGDGRLVIQLNQRYASPETWNVQVFVYGPEGLASTRTGYFEVLLKGSIDDVLARAEAMAFTSDLIERPATVH
jgi:hypothetical protein